MISENSGSWLQYAIEMVQENRKRISAIAGDNKHLLISAAVPARERDFFYTSEN